MKTTRLFQLELEVYLYQHWRISRNGNQKLDRTASTSTNPLSPLKQLKLKKKKSSRQEETFCEKIKLVDGRTAYVLRRSAGPDLSLESEPQEYECLKTSEESIMTDVHLEPEQLQDCPKD